MGKQPSKDSFALILGKRFATTQLTLTSVQPLHPKCWEVDIVMEKENKRNAAALASKMVSDSGFE
jgi:hypothetical protein